MKFQKWVEFKGATTGEIAELLGISKSQVHKYRFEDAIPKRDMMQKIYAMTGGMLRPDDFNDVSEKLFNDVNLQKFIYHKKKKKTKLMKKVRY
jgi:hypothetical protein